MDAKPLQIITAEEDHSFSLETENLSSVLLRDDVKNLKCVVISVAGAFRKGKSFLLNFFLKYLSGQGDGWMGDEHQPLTGFSWRGGSERETSGILMWSEPFICTDKNGEKVAVLLMDTQGSFDTQSTVRDCATVFALSTMLSSAQVYNISQNIQEDDLQHLQLFTEYGRLALSEDAEQAPFQSLVFLVRDWAYPYEHVYGTEGGNSLLSKRLEITDRQHEELQQLRKHIRSCFSSISCFLMPHPGLRVATSPNFKGELGEIDADFKTQLHQLVPYLLDSSSLVVKNISGNDITCADLLQFFKAYMGIFSGDELPEPRSMLQATAEANNLSAVSRAKEKYVDSMEKVCGGDQPYLHPKVLDDEHSKCKEAALELFNSIKKMGGNEFSAKFAENLNEEIEKTFESLKEHNDSKNIFAAARTPAVLLTMMVLCYLLSGVLDLVGLTSLSNLLTACVGLFLAMIVLWAYVRYSGEQRDLGLHVDTFAEFIWESVLRELYTKVTQRGVQMALNRQTSTARLHRPHND